MLRLTKFRHFQAANRLFNRPLKDHITLKSALEILDVKQHTKPAEIRKKLRLKALQCHPDRFPNDKLKEAEFVKLSRAYAILESAIKTNKMQEQLSKENQNHYDSMTEEDIQNTEHYRQFYEFSKIDEDLEDFDRQREISKRVWDVSLYIMIFFGAIGGAMWGREDIMRALTREERNAWKRTVKEARDEWKDA